MFYNITMADYNSLRLCELDNRKYAALVKAFEARTGNMGIGEKIIEKNWTMTLREFDSSNHFLSALEIFKIV